METNKEKLNTIQGLSAMRAYPNIQGHNKALLHPFFHFNQWNETSKMAKPVPLLRPQPIRFGIEKFKFTHPTLVMPQPTVHTEPDIPIQLFKQLI